jgi:hypothetical protein
VGHDKCWRSSNSAVNGVEGSGGYGPPPILYLSEGLVQIDTSPYLPYVPYSPLFYKKNNNIHALQQNAFAKWKISVEGSGGLEDLKMEIIDGRIGEEIDLPANAKALDVLQAVYRSTRMPLHTRVRAAALALPFESPKLQATAIIAGDLDFAAKLDRAIQRSDKVRMLLPAEQSFKRRF